MVCTRRNLGVYLACLGSDAPASAQNDVLHGAASNQGRGRFTSARACLLLPLLVLELHHSSSSCSVSSYSLYDSACEETQASRLFPACSLTSYSKNTTSIRPRVVCVHAPLRYATSHHDHLSQPTNSCSHHTTSQAITHYLD